MTRAFVSVCALASALAVSLVPLSASACSCIGYDHAGALAVFDVAFRGRVISSTPIGDESDVVLEVITPWKDAGARGARITIRLPTRLQICPVPELGVGGTFDVYARREGDRLTIGGCNPSRPTR